MNRVALEPGPVLGEGAVPTECCDVPGECSEGVPTRPVTLRAVEGVDPAVAVINADDTIDLPDGFVRVYTAPGYLIELPSHPLHDAVFGSSEDPDGQARHPTCSQLRTVVGEVMETPFIGSLDLRLSEPDDPDTRELVRDGIVVDAHTVVEGFSRDGLPFIEQGDQAAVDLRVCEAEDGTLIPLATHISPAIS
jgi:hypothetical protein